jgi:hypothetical protein
MRFAIVTSTGCAGFLLSRRQNYEAFDGDERSLGLYPSENDATTAILQNIATTYKST